MVGIDSFFLIVFGVPVLFLLVLAVWVLRKPLLALVPAPPDAVRRDLAYRIRATGYPVDATKETLRIKIDSLAAMKLHVRANPGGGAQIRYEVDATNAGWALVIVLALIGYAALIAIIVALIIHFRARRFARSHVAPILVQPPPLGTLPPMDARTLLVEGLSEAQRLSSEALEHEREARQNAVGLVLLAAIVLWAFTFLGLAVYSPLPVGSSFLLALGFAFAVSTVAAILGTWFVYARRSERVKELERDVAVLRNAWASGLWAGPVPGTAGGLETLLHATMRSPAWLEIRRRRRLWHDPVAGLLIFFFAYGTVLCSVLAVAFDVLGVAWQAFLGGLAVLLGVGGLWFVRHWRREVREQDERDRVDWDERRKAIEAELWRILSG